jgi:hypothetical protein
MVKGGDGRFTMTRCEPARLSDEQRTHRNRGE